MEEQYRRRMDIVRATELLAFTTAVLAFVAGLQLIATRRQARDQRRATAALEEQAGALKEQAGSLAATAGASQAMAEAMKTQADSLAASAAASREMADEMVEARKALNPLQLRFDRRPAAPGVLEGTLYNTSQRPVILKRLEVFRSQGTQPLTPVAVINYGNAYIGSGGTLVEERFAKAPFGDTLGDLVTVMVWGRPQDGIEQDREFLYRITGDWTLEEINPNEPLAAWG
jgi:hypothetical protein